MLFIEKFQRILSYKTHLELCDPTEGKSTLSNAKPHSAVGRAPDSQVRGPGFDTRSGHILSFLLQLIQEGQLSVTGQSMCPKYWLTLRRSKTAQEKCGYVN